MRQQAASFLNCLTIMRYGQVIGLTFPVPVLEIFHIYDIPERFFTERCNATYFDKICEKIDDFENIDPADVFAMPHLHDKYHMMLNCFCQGISRESKKYSGPEGQKLILCGLFAILYSYWDYKFDDINVGIDSGIEYLRSYQNNSILEKIPNHEKFVYKWINERVDIDCVCRLLEKLRRPYDDNFDGINSLEVEILKLLRDVFSYGPLYCNAYYPKELQEIQNYSLALALITYYGATSIEKINECINTYFTSSLMHEPYTEFMKNLISIYNTNKQNESNFLNEISIDYMNNYLSTYSNDLHTLIAKNPLTINEQMNIY